MLDINKIYNEDCLIGMSKIPDKTIDMICCDLPYGTQKSNGFELNEEYYKLSQNRLEEIKNRLW